jgi:hypothetical protein
MIHARQWNEMVRRFGGGDPVRMTRQQLEARFSYLRARGQTWEAVDLLKSWLAAEKSMPPSAVQQER